MKATPPMARPQLLTIPQVVDQLAVNSRASVYRLVYAGELDTVDTGTGTRPRIRIPAESVEAYIKRHTRVGRKTGKAAA